MTGSSKNDVYSKKYLVNYRVPSSGDTSAQKEVQQSQRQNVTKKSPDMNENSQIDCKENRSHSGKRSFYCQTNQPIRNNIEVKSNSNKSYSKSDSCLEPSLKKVKHDCLELEEVTDSGGCSEATPDVSSDEDRCQQYLRHDPEYKTGNAWRVRSPGLHFFSQVTKGLMLVLTPAPPSGCPGSCCWTTPTPPRPGCGGAR